MARFIESRYGERLQAAERTAAPHLVMLGLDGVQPEPYANTSILGPQRPLDPSIIAAAADIPASDVAAVRQVLLLRVVESDQGTARSTHGSLRAALAAQGQTLAVADLALELALCRFGLDLGFGVAFAWTRLSLLDPTLADLDRIEEGAVAVADDVHREAELLAALLANDTMMIEAGSTDRRFRLLGHLARAGSGRIPSMAFDDGDEFGQLMRSIVETDERLARALAVVLPLAATATSPLPDRRQRALVAAIAAVDAHQADEVRGAISRSVHQLLTAPLAPRGPGLVTVRPSNQRFGRAIVWLVPPTMPDLAAALLGELGVRMGTSGRRDNQARDTALANTCAALLGEMDDDAAVASLAHMLARIRNKPVRKQVEKALARVATRRGSSVDELVDGSLPSHGLDAEGRRSIPVGTWEAEVAVVDDGRVRTAWIGDDGEPRDGPPARLRDDHPRDVAGVAQRVEDIRSTLGDERHRLERSLAEGRPVPIVAWRRRFVDHPLGRCHGQRLIWCFTGSTGTFAALPDGDRLIDSAGASLGPPPADATVELWHPVEAPAHDVDRWRDLLVARRVTQPFRQVFRETYSLDPRFGLDGVLDARFADRPLAYGQMRALMGERGWTAPMLGPFDQGDRSVAFRDFAVSGLRAELVHVPAGLDGPNDKVGFARSGSLRFTAASDDGRSPVLLASVPARLLSEVLRDVDLFTSVPDPMRTPTSASDTESPPTVATRAAALRRIVPTLPHAKSLAVVGRWLRVEDGPSSWAISLATGATVRLSDEQDVDVTLPPEPIDVGYVPHDDELLRGVLATAAVLLGRA